MKKMILGITAAASIVSASIAGYAGSASASSLTCENFSSSTTGAALTGATACVDRAHGSSPGYWSVTGTLHDNACDAKSPQILVTDFGGKTLGGVQGHSGCGTTTFQALSGVQSTTRIYISVCNVPGGSCAFPTYFIDDFNE